MDENPLELKENMNQPEDPLLSQQPDDEVRYRPTEDLDLEFEDESEEEEADEEDETEGQKIYDPLNIKPEFSNKTLLESAKANLQLKNVNDTSFEYEESSGEGEEYQFNEQPIKTEQPKENKAGLFVSGGICCMTFTFSVLLWVILFADLTHRANEISMIVEKNPTLEDHYQMYLKFYNEFYESTVQYEDTTKMLNMKDNSELLDYKRSIVEVLTIEDRMKTHINDLEDSIERMEYSNELRVNVENLSTGNENMKKNFSTLQSMQVDFQGFYMTVLKNVHALYTQAFQLIDLYGYFYINTNRIWVSTENIYQLFEKRAVDVQAEAKKKHYKPMVSRKDDVELNHFEYQSGSIVAPVEPFSIHNTEELYLSCFIRAEVNNPDLKYLDRSFSLSLGLNNHNPLLLRNSFAYGVTEKFNRISFHQALSISPGKNIVHLYAKLNKGDIKLNYVNVECLLFEEYADIPEFDTN